MVYRKKYRSYKRKYNTRYRKRSTLNNRISKIAKTVALRTQETKHYHEHIANGTQILHNVWTTVRDNMIQVPATGSNDNRTGDQITLRGIKLYVYTEHPEGRCNVNWRFVIGKLAPNASGVVRTKGLTGRTINDPLDMDHYSKVCRDIRFNIKNDAFGDGTAPNRQKYSRCSTIWLPLNNYKYRFENHSSSAGRDWELQLGVTAFDNDASSQSDVLGTISIASVLYFKDA